MEPRTLGECVVGDYITIDGKQARFSFLVTGTPFFRWMEQDAFEGSWIEAHDLSSLPASTPVRLVRRVNLGGNA